MFSFVNGAPAILFTTLKEDMGKKCGNWHGSYNLEKVLNFSSRLEKSLNSVKVLEKYLISLLGLEKSLKFRNLFIPYHFSEKLNDFAG